MADLTPLTAEEIERLRALADRSLRLGDGAHTAVGGVLLKRLCAAAESAAAKDEDIADLTTSLNDMIAQRDSASAQMLQAFADADDMRRRVREAEAEAAAKDAEIEQRKEDAAQAGAEIERLQWLLGKERQRAEKAEADALLLTTALREAREQFVDLQDHDEYGFAALGIREIDAAIAASQPATEAGTGGE